MPGDPSLDCTRSGDTLTVRMAGRWTLQEALPPVETVAREVVREPPRCLTFDAREIETWDSGFLTFLLHVREAADAEGVESDVSALPEGVKRLLALASAVPDRSGARRVPEPSSFLERVGRASEDLVTGGREMLAFLGEATLSFGRLLTGRARYRGVDLWLVVQETGANALPIVTLISVLVGMILAFVGAVQLREFGAGIYVADLVGLAMAREMGAMMTAIIMAGRTGAAFAAQIGSMRVNQEIDALTTLGFSPIDFLVLPRMLALAFMMPLLCIYADVLGILGGAVVGVGMLDLTAGLYWEQTLEAVALADFGVGLVKASAFGVLVAIAGCLRGVQCGTSSASVGLAATSAVVTGIVAIIVTDALFTVLFDVLGI